MNLGFMLTGLILLNADFPVATLPSSELYPCAIYANDQYYLFWTDCRIYPIYSLYGARVTTTGVVLDPNGKFLFADSVSNPRVAYDGTNFLVVWREGC